MRLKVFWMGFLLSHILNMCDSQKFKNTFKAAVYTGYSKNCKEKEKKNQIGMVSPTPHPKSSAFIFSLQLFLYLWL